jgi:hypothetical protein
MKRLILIAALAIILLSCDNGAMEEDKGPFSLIGEWEATGEFIREGNVIYRYECSLVFGESDFTEITHAKSDNAPVGWNAEWSSKIIGTYIQGDSLITGECQQVFDDDSKTGLSGFNQPYQFVNKNTLKYTGIQLAVLTNNVTYIRKR